MKSEKEERFFEDDGEDQRFVKIREKEKKKEKGKRKRKILIH